ncbi:SURF1 family protein [Oryzibacter oryziterrae]|uniref:SURF1 family protein n=1 Tax=Oryzibacter oryziterrae TaxID=2766474 RepID=UPI001F3ACD52|nr:SURF1 family protein [Oryzibacter oryziterrae]
MTDAVLPRRSFVRLTVAAAIAFLILVGLGTWQVQRLHWKEALIDSVNARVHLAPVPMPAPRSWAGLDTQGLAYTPVTVSGSFDHSHEIHVFIALAEPRGRFGGPGYFVLTPLKLDGGQWVFVNRGFVPEANRDPATRLEGQVSGPQTVSGLLRPSEQPSWLSPADDIAKNVWFVRNTAAMAKAAGIDPATVAPFTIDAFAGTPGSLPQGGETIVSFPNNHLGYILTWYGLAGTLLAIWGVMLRRRLAGT